MSEWNFADVWEVVAEVLPDAPALVHGPLRRVWREANRRADGLAAALVENGVTRGDTVAQYLYSGPEYLESVFAAFKLGLPPVNTNYRYAPDELAYIWGNADCGAVVFHGEFTERADAVRARVPGVKAWLHVDDGTHPCPPWAVPYEDAASTARGPRGQRSPDDLYLVYTGGTTGLPKGVMWRQDDLFAVLNATGPVRYPLEGGLDDVRRMLVKPGPPHLPAAPLMHGTGAFTSFAVMSCGGSIVTLTGRHFSAAELLDTIDRERVRSLAIVGDAFAKPMLSALDADPSRWDVSSLRVLASSGVMFSAAVKEGLLRHMPRLTIADTLGSSEAIGMAASVTTSGSPSQTAVFTVDARTRVITEDGRDVQPGSGEVGLMAQRGRVPLGYYKDEAKTAGTFRVLDGVRWSVPGDWATVDADGTLRLLGRGSQCINTGGEKVYPEEVEETLKTFPGVADAACVGVPDDRFGEVVVAVVEARDGAAVDERALIAHVKAHLAGYKAPRRVVQVPTLGRAPNGKVDYRALRVAAAGQA